MNANQTSLARNRILVVLLLAALLAVIVLVTQGVTLDTLFPGTAQETPEQIIERNGLVDVVYYKAVERGVSIFGGNTPIVGITLILYDPNPEDADTAAHIELTPQGYDIVYAPYEWSPDMEEDYQAEINNWNWAKYNYYHDNALFKPGEAKRVASALFEMSERWTDNILAELFLDIFRAACMTEEKWNFIEIDMIKLEWPSEELAVTEDGEPTTAVVLPARLQTTVIIYRARNEETEVFVDGKWATITERHTIDEIVERGTLTMEELNHMVEVQQMQFIPGLTFFGPRSYNRGFNCEWQGREILMVQQILAAREAQQAAYTETE